MLDQRQATPITNKMKRDRSVTFESLAEEYGVSETELTDFLERALGVTHYSQLESLDKQRRKQQKKMYTKANKSEDAESEVEEKKNLKDLKISEGFLSSQITGTEFQIREIQRTISQQKQVILEAQQKLEKDEQKIRALENQKKMQEHELRTVRDEIERLEGMEITYIISPDYEGELPKYWRALISTASIKSADIEIHKMTEEEWSEKPSFDLIRKSKAESIEQFVIYYEFVQLVLMYATNPDEKIQLLYNTENQVLVTLLHEIGF